jgi:hypothetical protein
LRWYKKSRIRVRFTALNISGNFFFGENSERDIRDHQAIQNMLAVGDGNGGHNLVRVPGQFAEHARGMLGVVRFFQHFPIEDNDGIRSQYGQIARRLRHAGLCFLSRQARDILLRAFAAGSLFFDTGDNAFKRYAQLRQQFLTAR